MESIDDILAHIRIAGSSSVEIVRQPSAGGAGDSGFDESKVKRDNNGKFAKTAGGGSSSDVDKALNELKVKQNEELVKKYGPSIITMPFADFIKTLPEDERAPASADLLSTLQRQILEQSKLKKQFQKQVRHSDMVDDVVRSIIEADENDAEQHGVKGQKWGVRRTVSSATGLVTGGSGKAKTAGETSGLIPRKGSADQIHQDRIQKKIDTVGVHALSSAELQSYTRRLQMEKDVKTALAAQSAAQKAKADSFIKSFVKKQGSRQADRFVNKALDVAFEAAVKQAGVKLEGSNPQLGKGLLDVSRRMAPKKGK